MQQKLVKGGIVSGIVYELVVYKDSPASQVTRDLGDFMHVQQNACAAKRMCNKVHCTCACIFWPLYSLS